MVEHYRRYSADCVCIVVSLQNNCEGTHMTEREREYQRGFTDGYNDANGKLVRCRECRECIPNFLGKEGLNHCKVWIMTVDAEDFCSRGERK